MYIAVSFAIGFSVNNIFEQYLIAKMSISSSSENRDEITEDNLVSALISLSSLIREVINFNVRHVWFIH